MRDLVTTAFEVIGLLLIASALGVWLYRIDPALGLLGAGVALLLASGAVIVLEGRGSGDET